LTIAAFGFKNKYIEDEPEDEDEHAYDAVQSSFPPASFLFLTAIYQKTLPSICILHVIAGTRYRDENIIDISLFFGETAAC
jgi:hypothetical protein